MPVLPHRAVVVRVDPRCDPPACWERQQELAAVHGNLSLFGLPGLLSRQAGRWRLTIGVVGESPLERVGVAERAADEGAGGEWTQLVALQWHARADIKKERLEVPEIVVTALTTAGAEGAARGAA
jgi:hypothetical protein